MIYHSLSEIFDVMDETRARLLKRLAGVESSEAHLRPMLDAWSVAEITEHLAITEERLSKLFQVLLTKAEAAGLERRSDEPFRPVSVETAMQRSKREKYTTPETTRPKGTASIADSVARLECSREAIKALRPRLDALELTSLAYSHPVFGPFNAYQWLLFIAAHEGRHLRQIESVLSELQAEAKAE